MLTKIAYILLDRFLREGIFSRKKGHQLHDFGGSQLMAWKVFQRVKFL
ncbi:hypothetical protein D1BOALGB6SA_2690 [Olavius sp. associated proteobacterium Delta 1]|nr:hypothetical protein D1BOALGB6SA_2690 [Olavius sp. associated proteobacterium Delta 1]